MRPWTIAVIGVGIIVIAAVVIYFVVKKRKAEAEEEMEENLGEDGPPGSYDTPGLDDLAKDLVEGTVKTTLDIAWSGAKAIASPVAEPIGNALWKLFNINFEKHEFIRAWEGKRDGVNLGPAVKEMYYTAAWRTDPELKEAVAGIPGMLGELEEARRWLVESHLVPEEKAIYVPPLPTTEGESFVFVEAWATNPFVKVGDMAYMTLVWRNDTREMVTWHFRLELEHENQITIEDSALPGETKATQLKCKIEDRDWRVGDYIDARVWWKKHMGTYIGKNYVQVGETMKEAYMIVDVPVYIPPFLY